MGISFELLDIQGVHVIQEKSNDWILNRKHL